MSRTKSPNNRGVRKTEILSIIDLEILRVLDKECTLKGISSVLRQPKSTISEHLSKLKKVRLIRAKGNTINKSFERLPKGTEVLRKASEGGYKSTIKLFRIHNLSYTMKHNRPHSLMSRIAERGCYMAYPRNQYKEFKNYRGEVLGCTIEVRPSCIMVALPVSWSFSIEEGISQAIGKVIEVKAELEREFDGLQLGEPERIATLSSQHIAVIGDPISSELSGFCLDNGKMIYRGKNLHVDFSTGLPEMECVNRVTSVDDMERVCRLAEYVSVGSLRAEQIVDVSRFLEGLGLGFLAPAGSLVSAGSNI